MTFGAMDKITDHYEDVGPGWRDLLTQAHEEVQAADPEYQTVQVKEKFGGLRLYIYGSKAAQDAVHKYEHKSYEVCEICGAPGKMDESHMWYLTLCPEHTAKRNELPTFRELVEQHRTSDLQEVEKPPVPGRPVPPEGGIIAH